MSGSTSKMATPTILVELKMRTPGSDHSKKESAAVGSHFGEETNQLLDFYIFQIKNERRKKKADAAGPAIEKATAAAEEAKLQGYCQQQ
uniref:Uncharacterized protein n=1 Tax=Ascaris lumbricoides TaxID=6252 RepID=A0A0M3HUJ2_ASCLU